MFGRDASSHKYINSDLNNLLFEILVKKNYFGCIKIKPKYLNPYN